MPKKSSGRVTRRRGTKTKVIATGKGGKGIKSRYARLWKRNGQYQTTIENPNFK